MSNVEAASPQPKSPASPKKRAIPTVVWLMVLLAAAAAFGAAVVWAGGINEVLNLVGLGSVTSASQNPSQQGGGGATKPPASSATTGLATAATAPRLPASASDAMYREQLQSQASLRKLVDNKIASFTLGTPKTTNASAVVPLTVTLRNGSSASGRMTFKKYNDVWYFLSLTASGGGSTTPRSAVDPAVVSVITRQQATKGNQEMIKDGILGGGFKNARVTGVSKGSGTVTVDVTLSGGSAPTKKGQFVCIVKKDGPTKYWFLSRFATQ